MAECVKSSVRAIGIDWCAVDVTQMWTCACRLQTFQWPRPDRANTHLNRIAFLDNDVDNTIDRRLSTPVEDGFYAPSPSPNSSQRVWIFGFFIAWHLVAQPVSPVAVCWVLYDAIWYHSLPLPGATIDKKNKLVCCGFGFFVVFLLRSQCDCLSSESLTSTPLTSETETTTATTTLL